MFIFFAVLLYHLWGARCVAAENNDSSLMLFDFSQDDAVKGWVEVSDTVRDVGKSKAALVAHKSKLFQRAVFFTLLNPQPNGAAFAGMYYRFDHWNLKSFEAIKIMVRGQGENQGYKMVLCHFNQASEPFPTYAQFFTAPMNKFDVVTLPFKDFEPYYRGMKSPGYERLDKSYISTIGLQVYGGVYLPTNQSGVSSLEIEWIKAV